MRIRDTGTRGLLLAAALLLATGLAAQDPRLRRFFPRTQQDPLTAPLLTLDPEQLLRDELPIGFRTVQRDLQSFQGFPVYPPDWPGWQGGVGTALPSPFATDESGTTQLPLQPAPRLPDRPNSWPSWFGGLESAEEGGFRANRALLTRSSDRVWYRAPEEPVFIPLAFYDKFRAIEAGVDLEVRHKGEYEITFHGGAFLRAQGPSRIEVLDLSEALISFRLPNFTELWLNVLNRPMRITLPDGSLLLADDFQVLRFHRDGAMGTIINHGREPVRLRTSFGDYSIPPSTQVLMMMPERGRPFIPAQLQLDAGLEARRVGRVLVVEGGSRGGTVVWNGARVQLEPGSTLRVDPLAGEQFPENQAPKR